MTLDKTRQKVVKPNSLVYVELTSANLTLFLTRHTETQQSNGEQSSHSIHREEARPLYACVLQVMFLGCGAGLNLKT